jgi:hypothetical protein
MGALPSGSSTRTGHLRSRRRPIVVPNWSPGDTIPLGRDRMLRVVEIRLPQDDDYPS